jgi:hypothetical protein
VSGLGGHLCHLGGNKRIINNFRPIFRIYTTLYNGYTSIVIDGEELKGILRDPGSASQPGKGELRQRAQTVS